MHAGMKKAQSSNDFSVEKKSVRGENDGLVKTCHPPMLSYASTVQGAILDLASRSRTFVVLPAVAWTFALLVVADEDVPAGGCCMAGVGAGVAAVSMGQVFALNVSTCPRSVVPIGHMLTVLTSIAPRSDVPSGHKFPRGTGKNTWNAADQSKNASNVIHTTSVLVS
jgi:hypothetical protein